MQNKKLTHVDHHPFLGIELQRDMKFNKHIDMITDKAQKTLNMVKRTLKNASQTTKSHAYKAIVRPKLEYASAVWDPHTKSEINKIAKIQNRAARWVTNNYSQYSSVTQLQNQLNWPPLHSRRLASRLTIFYKILHFKIAIPLPPYVTLQTKLTRRNSETTQYRRLSTSTNMYKYSFFPQTIIDWTDIPPGIRQSNSVEVFKQRLSSHLNL